MASAVTSAKHAADAASIGAGGMDRGEVVPQRRDLLIEALTSIRTERAVRFVLPIPILTYMSYRPVPHMIFSQLLIILYMIQAALLPPIMAMVPVVLFCALPAICIALGVLTLFCYVWAMVAEGHLHESTADWIVLTISFFYFLLASNLRLGPLAGIMTIAYYAAVYSLEYASIMTKYLMIHGIDVHLKPFHIAQLLPSWLANLLPSNLLSLGDNLWLSLDAKITPSLLGDLLNYRGMKRLLGVHVSIFGSAASGIHAVLPGGTHLLRYIWEGEKQFGVFSALISWAFISYAAFTVTQFLPPFRSGTGLYRNATAGCHATISANIIDWLRRIEQPEAGQKLLEQNELRTMFGVAEETELPPTTEPSISEPRGNRLSSVRRTSRLATMLPPVRKNSHMSPGSLNRSPSGSNTLAPDRSASSTVRFAASPLRSASMVRGDSVTDDSESDASDDFNPYYGYDITRFQSLAHAKRFAENDNVSKVIAQYPSFRARFNLELQSLSTMQGPLLLSLFECFAAQHLRSPAHNFSNDLPERLKVSASLEDIASWLYIIQTYTTLHDISNPRKADASMPVASSDASPVAEAQSRRASYDPHRSSNLERMNTLAGSTHLGGRRDSTQPPMRADTSASATGGLGANLLLNEVVGNAEQPPGDGVIDGDAADAIRRKSSRMSRLVDQDDADLMEGIEVGSAYQLARRSTAGVPYVPEPDSSNAQTLHADGLTGDDGGQAVSTGREGETESRKSEVATHSKFVDFMARQRDRRLKSQILPAVRYNGKGESRVTLPPTSNLPDLFCGMLLSVYHSLRLSEMDDNTKQTLNDVYAERKIIGAYKKRGNRYVASQRPQVLLYGKGLLTATNELLELRRDSFIQLRTKSWKRLAISAGTIIMGLPLFFYCLIAPWLQGLRYLAEQRRLSSASLDMQIILTQPVRVDSIAVKSVLVKAGSSIKAHVSTPGATGVVELGVRTRPSEGYVAWRSGLWFSIRLAVGNLLIFGIGLVLERWRTLNVTGRHRREVADFIDLERLMATKYAGWACIGFITTITETSSATIKRAILRFTGVVLGTVSAYAALSISEKSITLHSIWLVVTCFIAVWVTAHPANPAIGFDPSWGYAAQLFTYQQVIIMALVAVQEWDVTEIVISRLTAQVIGIGCAVLLSLTLAPTIPGPYIRNQIGNAIEHLQNHIDYFSQRFHGLESSELRSGAELHLARMDHALRNARRCITDNELFVEFYWLNVGAVEIEMVETLERLAKIHRHWTDQLELVEIRADNKLVDLMNKLRCIICLSLSTLKVRDPARILPAELRNACVQELRDSIMAWLSLRPSGSTAGRLGDTKPPEGPEWDARTLAGIFAPIEFLEINRLARLIDRELV